MSANFKEDCLFCDVSRHKVTSKIIDEDEEIIVIQNKEPRAPIHLLVMPKSHVSKVTAHTTDHNGLYDRLIKKCGYIAQKMGLADGDYKIIINGGKLAHFDHEHLHFMGGWGESRPDWE